MGPCGSHALLVTRSALWPCTAIHTLSCLGIQNADTLLGGLTADSIFLNLQLHRMFKAWRSFDHGIARDHQRLTCRVTLQVAVLVTLIKFWILGATHGHLRYSNHVPASWSDPYISFGEKTWGQPDYNYFRGTDDRNPIFISRRLHLAFAYCV